MGLGGGRTTAGIQIRVERILPKPCKHGNPLQSFLKDGDTQFCSPNGGMSGQGATPGLWGSTGVHGEEEQVPAAQGGAGAQLGFWGW